jgi:hypothetical protein
MYERRDSSVGMAAGYGLEGWGLIPGRESDFSLLHSIQTGFRDHIDS